MQKITIKPIRETCKANQDPNQWAFFCLKKLLIWACYGSYMTRGGDHFVLLHMNIIVL